MKLALSRVHYPVTTLGPGRRLGIWLQGCSIRCPGCISADTWAKREADLEVAELLHQVRGWLEQCDGVTVSGGEPFEQPGALMELLRRIRTTRDTNTLVYSGLPLERLLEHEIAREGLIDCLIADPFDIAANQSMYMRGSDNQRMACLTPLGLQLFAALDRPATKADQRLDVMFDADGVVWLAGIPRRGDMRRLQNLLAGEGSRLTTTEARS